MNLHYIHVILRTYYYIYKSSIPQCREADNVKRKPSSYFSQSRSLEQASEDSFIGTFISFLMEIRGQRNQLLYSPTTGSEVTSTTLLGPTISDQIWCGCTLVSTLSGLSRSSATQFLCRRIPRNLQGIFSLDRFYPLIPHSCSWLPKATWWSASWSGRPWTRRSQSASVCSRVGCSPCGSGRCRYPSAPSGPGRSSCGRSCTFLYSTWTGRSRPSRIRVPDRAHASPSAPNDSPGCCDLASGYGVPCAPCGVFERWRCSWRIVATGLEVPRPLLPKMRLRRQKAHLLRVRVNINNNSVEVWQSPSTTIHIQSPFIFIHFSKKQSGYYVKTRKGLKWHDVG